MFEKNSFAKMLHRFTSGISHISLQIFPYFFFPFDLALLPIIFITGAIILFVLNS
jgi:hypothetical protein